MNQSDFRTRVQQWAQEFTDMTQEVVTLPVRFIDFMYARMNEAGGVSFDPNSVLAMIQGRQRRIVIKGRVPGTNRLQYELCDGSIGFGIVPATEIAQEDQGRAADILDRLEKRR